jgi:hypothetical protein
MAGLRSRFNRFRTFGYVDAVRYPGNPGFLTGGPFLPFFMAFDQVFDKIPAFRVYPLID